MSLSGQNGGFNGAVLQYSTYGLKPVDVTVFFTITSGSMYLSGMFILSFAAMPTNNPTEINAIIGIIQYLDSSSMVW